MPILSHKIALDPTYRQREYFQRACGTARFTWNWALAEWNRQHEAGEKPTAMGLKKQFNAIKYREFPWLQGVHRDTHSQPFADLGNAFSRFFKTVGGRPRFKKKGKCRDSFYVANNVFEVQDHRVRLPLVGWVRMRETLRFRGKIVHAVVSRTADRWFISIAVEMPADQAGRARVGDSLVGVDVGLKHAAVFSTGEKIEPPKPLTQTLRRLRIHSRRLSRKQKGSKNHAKQARRLARLYAHAANTRHDFWHKLTSKLCRENQTVVIEDLNVQGMKQCRSLARALCDVGFGTMRPMLEYKAPLFETKLVIANRWFPSSRLCPACGTVNDKLMLSDRTWTCACGAVHDRDLNAARNLANLALLQALGEVTPVIHEMVPEATRGRNRSKPQALHQLVAA